MHNPLLVADGLPAFADIRPEHVEPAMQAVLKEGRELLAKLTQLPSRSFAQLVVPLEELQHRIASVWSPIEHLNSVCNSGALRKVYKSSLAWLSEFQSDLSQSEILYQEYQKILTDESLTLNPEQLQVIQHTLRSFHLAGVGLPPAEKRHFKALQQELSQQQSKFEENVLDAMNAWQHHVVSAADLNGLNAQIIAQAQANAAEQHLPGWLLKLDQPTYLAVMTTAESRNLRRTFYEAWHTRAAAPGPEGQIWDNSAVIEQILALRHHIATLLGYESFAHYALATRMARNVPEVLQFLSQLAQAAKPAAQRELVELTEFAGHPLEAWDINFYSESLMQRRFTVSQEELRVYFPLPRVLDGLFTTVERLFGITLRENRAASKWHADVRYFDLYDSHGSSLGGVYLDLYARPHKRSGAWMHDCIGRKRLSAETTQPVAFLVCNFLPASADRPALLTHDDVVTLFHEFGHGLHHLLTTVNYPSLAGINGVAWDAVELPSQFLENYAWSEPVLRSISAHIDTGESLPTDKLQQLLASRSFHAGLATLRQLEFALFDFRLHAQYQPRYASRLDAILAEVRREVSVVAVPDWNRFAHSFAHIFAGGYAAGYYSYKWSEVLAADAFAAFAETGIFDQHTAQRFLNTILARGGACDALDAFVAFRGRKPDITALLKQDGIYLQSGNL
jgi:oligopeptidase A